MSEHPPEEARRAALVTIPTGATASTAFTLVVAECTAHWRANVPGVLQRRDPESLHQVRVGVRRLRSGFSLFRRAFSEQPAIVSVSAELRARATPLGRARDLDILLAGPVSSGLTPTELAGLRGLHERAYDEVVALLTSSAWASLAARVDDLATAAPWSVSADPPALEVASSALELRWERVLGHGARLRDLAPPARHLVRIEAKKLRYGAQFFASLYAGSTGSDPLAFAETVAGLQDALGELNDVVTARMLLAEVGAVGPAADETCLIDAAVAAWNAVGAVTPFWR